MTTQTGTHTLPAGAADMIDAAVARGGPFPAELEAALPWLNANGLQPVGRAEKCASQFTGDVFFREFSAAADWLRNVKPIAGMNRKRSSYGLKHVAERASKEGGGYGYISNGAFILAALYAGFRCQQIEQSLNARFNMSERDIKENSADEMRRRSERLAAQERLAAYRAGTSELR